MQHALQAETLFVGGNLAEDKIRTGIKSAVEWGGTLFENRDAPVVIC